MEIWVLLVVGNLLMPVELHSEDACATAAKFIANDIKATVYCISPQSGEVAKFEATYN